MFLATNAVAYQAGLRYGTFNQLEFVNQNTFLKNELDQAYRVANKTQDNLNLHITWLRQEGEEHFKTIGKFKLADAYVKGNQTETDLKSTEDHLGAAGVKGKELEGKLKDTKGKLADAYVKGNQTETDLKSTEDHLGAAGVKGKELEGKLKDTKGKLADAYVKGNQTETDLKSTEDHLGAAGVKGKELEGKLKDTKGKLA